MRFIKISFSAFVLCLIGIILFLNAKLYYHPEVKAIEGDSINYDLLCELRGLRQVMDNNADEEMQQLYLEGYLFLNALYGLSWSEFAATANSNSTLYKEAHIEIQRAYDHIDSNQGREIFDESLSLPYGAFYTGWRAYVLAKKLGVESPGLRNPEEINLFNEHCEKIANILPNDNYPESYPRAAWPLTSPCAWLLLQSMISFLKHVIQQSFKTGLVI